MPGEQFKRAAQRSLISNTTEDEMRMNRIGLKELSTGLEGHMGSLHDQLRK